MSKNAEERAIYFENLAAKNEKEIAVLKGQLKEIRQALDLLARETVETFKRQNELLAKIGDILGGGTK